MEIARLRMLLVQVEPLFEEVLSPEYEKPEPFCWAGSVEGSVLYHAKPASGRTQYAVFADKVVLPNKNVYADLVELKEVAVDDAMNAPGEPPLSW